MGHVPESESSEIEIMSFLEAKKKSENSRYDHDKWIYIPEDYKEYRYVLGTVGKNPLIVMGVNPSTAEADKLDNTLRSVEKIVKANGYDSFIMLNVYAQRATNPKDMDKIFNQNLHKENMAAFRWALDRCGTNPAIWAAWGTIIEESTYLKWCLKEIVKDIVKHKDEKQVKWYKAGKISKKGHPHHPLYLKSDTKLEEFDMEGYLQLLG